MPKKCTTVDSSTICFNQSKKNGQTNTIYLLTGYLVCTEKCKAWNLNEVTSMHLTEGLVFSVWTQGNQLINSWLTAYMQQDNIVIQQKCWIMYQSIPSLTILPLGDPRGFARSHCTRGRVFAELSLPRGSGFWTGEICYNSERNMQELLDLIQRSWRQLEKQVFLCCFILIFAKQ